MVNAAAEIEQMNEIKQNKARMAQFLDRSSTFKKQVEQLLTFQKEDIGFLKFNEIEEEYDEEVEEED